MLSESFSLPDAGTTPTLVVSLLVVCAGAGTVSVFVTVVVWAGVVTVSVRPAPLACVLVSVGPVPLASVVVPAPLPAGWSAVLTLLTALEPVSCVVSDPQALTAKAINAPAMSASTILAASLVLAALKVDSVKARDTDPSVGDLAFDHIIPFG